jgi:dynein heavy chain
VSETITEQFKLDVQKLLGHLAAGGVALQDIHIRNLMFGDFMDPHADIKIYDEITDLDEASETMEKYLSEYNMLTKTPMHLVLFKFAIEHVSRIARVLKQDNGHALLIGIGGSGRQSVTKMAAFMSGYDLIQVGTELIEPVSI